MDNRGTPSRINFEIRESEDDSDDGAASEEAERRRKGKMVVPEIEIDIPREGETDSEDDDEYQRQFNIARLESLNPQYVEAHEPSSRRNTEAEILVDENDQGAEYERDLNVAIVDSLKSYYARLAREHEVRPESEAAEGKFINSSSDSDDSGRTISNIIPTEPRDTEFRESITRPHVSSYGRLLKPTAKLLQLSSATSAPAGDGTSGSKRKRPKMSRAKAIIAREISMSPIPVCADGGSNDATLPSKRKRNDGASIDNQTKQKAAKPIPSVPRFNEGETTLNRRPRGLLRRHGVGGAVGASGPRGSRSVVDQAGQANGVAHQANVVNPNGSCAGVDVGEPNGSGYVAGQASRANGMAQADMVNPNGSGASVEVGEPSGPGDVAGQASEANAVSLPEPMVCVTNMNPMDLTIEEARTYMRSENRVSSTGKVKLFGTYIS